MLHQAIIVFEIVAIHFVFIFVHQQKFHGSTGFHEVRSLLEHSSSSRSVSLETNADPALRGGRPGWFMIVRFSSTLSLQPKNFYLALKPNERVTIFAKIARTDSQFLSLLFFFYDSQVQARTGVSCSRMCVTVVIYREEAQCVYRGAENMEVLRVYCNSVWTGELGTRGGASEYIATYLSTYRRVDNNGGYRSDGVLLPTDVSGSGESRGTVRNGRRWREV